jgi:hypothetical protein
VEKSEREIENRREALRESPAKRSRSAKEKEEDFELQSFL